MVSFLRRSAIHRLPGCFAPAVEPPQVRQRARQRGQHAGAAIGAGRRHFVDLMFDARNLATDRARQLPPQRVGVDPDLARNLAPLFGHGRSVLFYGGSLRPRRPLMAPAQFEEALVAQTQLRRNGAQGHLAVVVQRPRALQLARQWFPNSHDWPRQKKGADALIAPAPFAHSSGVCPKPS
ncbi:MAG: hypothetical protein K2Y29_08115 [Beijerinckiaceae bacterium]|nr:hypothetical protein [Beijerinckiaceae bacterium]